MCARLIPPYFLRSDVNYKERQKKIKDYWEKCTPMSFVDEKWSYEQKREFRYGLQDYMHESFRFGDWAGKKVLEIGCGSGVDALEFARHGAIVTATDMTDNAVNLTGELAKEAGLSVEVVQASAASLPFSNASFDCVYSYGVLHHIPDVEVALGEIKRVLKDGGTLMAMLYNRSSLLYAYSIIYRHGIVDRLLLDSICTESELVSRYSERIEGCPYTKAYTKEEAKAFFSRWFRAVEITVRYNVIDAVEQRKVKTGLDDKWELGWHLVVRATK
jgi:ubiquinone/menaquinone biosynthesis C-methylase UbiE